ncbi:hypothetical protein AB0K21_12840 [Streptosporangium sp. NPDC049248]|uniref:hypothetical protein n=1 Tax=Streptosporangium sp. NPDC049248 TaxID=3155651 RepID=UPI00342039F5
MKRVTTLLVLGLLTALSPAPAQAVAAERQLVVHSVQADPTYTGLCRGAENGVRVTARLTYTGPGETYLTLVFDGPGSREITGVLLRTRTGSTSYHLAITAPASHRTLSQSSTTTCAAPPVDIATVSELNYDGACGPAFSTPLRAKITSGKGTTRYQWVDENEQPLLGSEVQTVQITEDGGTQYVDGPRLPRQRPGSGKVALLFPDLNSTPLMSGLTAWSTTCRPLATPNLTQVEFTSEDESCELPRPAIFTLKGSITALGPGPIRYAYARKSAQTNNAWVRDPWTSLTLTSAGIVDVSRQWTVPAGRRGEQGYWRLEIDEPYTSVSGQARYWFYCPD